MTEELGNNSQLAQLLTGLFERFEKNINQKIDTVEKNINEKIDTINERIDNVEKNINERIDNVEKIVGDIKQKVDSGFKNIGSLYEINVLDFLKKKYTNSSISNPKILAPDFNLLDERVRKSWETMLSSLVKNNRLTQKEANCLTLDTTAVEFNFIITTKTKKVLIFEATMASFKKTDHLVRKLLQLERQIMAYKLCNNNKSPTKVGFVTPSNIEETRIAKIVAKHS